jgi:cephalosporin hydroxylase
VPTDLWNYQEIFTERRIEWVIETGSAHGGSALFFADLLELAKTPGKVITIDVSHAALQIRQHPRIEFLLASSGSAETAARVAQMLPPQRGALFMILDSDHSKAHVLRELEVLTPLLRRGDYLVVEDSCINGHPVRPEFGPDRWKRSRNSSAPIPTCSSPIPSAKRNSALPPRRPATWSRPDPSMWTWR